MQVIFLAVQTAQAVPTVTLLDMLRIQGLWLWNHSAIVISGCAGAWKLSRSIKKLPERITAPVSKRMDDHEKLDNDRQQHNVQALADTKSVLDEKWEAMRISVEQINLTLSRSLRGQHGD